MSALIPRSATWELLASSKNPASLSLLANGLSSSSEEVRFRCLTTLLDRPEPASRMAILRVWDALRPEEVECIRSKSTQFQRPPLSYCRANDWMSSERPFLLSPSCF